MASFRDAYKRLEVIYNATSPEAQEKNNADAGLDEFTRLKKKVHVEIKNIRLVSAYLNLGIKRS
jgi:hypothetical protein